MPRDITSAFKALIDKLNYDKAQGAEPNFRLDVITRNPEQGIRSGTLVTDNQGLTDKTPSIIQSSVTNTFYAVYARDVGGNDYIFGAASSEDGDGNIIWPAGMQLFEGSHPDLEFDGEFTSQGAYLAGELMIVYEKSGTIYFRKADVENSGWSELASATEKTVVTGTDPTIVRGWADPPAIGETDLGVYVFYIDSGDLKFTYSTDYGNSWETAVEIDKPTGGTKGDPKAFRESSYRLACVYQYDDGSKTDIYFILSQDPGGGTPLVNIASPDEVYKLSVMNVACEFFDLLDYDAPDEDYKLGAKNLHKTQYDSIIAGYEDEGEDCEVPDEIYKIGVKNLNMRLFTGEEP